MSNLGGQPGQLRMVVEIKRAATGKTDVIELVGNKITLTGEGAKAPAKDEDAE